MRGICRGQNVILMCPLYIVVANEGQRIDIPDGCVLENSKFIAIINWVRFNNERQGCFLVI